MKPDAGAHQAAQDLDRNVAPTINNLTRTPGKTLPAAAAKVIVIIERAVYDHGYALVLKNTSTSAEAQNTDVAINAVDKTGTVIASASTTVNLIPAGSTFIVADDLDIERGAAVKELQVRHEGRAQRARR